MKYNLLVEKNDDFKDYYLDTSDDSLSYLPNFNKINIIIGANNSGKSRFMRKLMSQKNLRLIDFGQFSNYNEVVDDMNSYLTSRGNYDKKLSELNQDSTIDQIINDNLSLHRSYIGNRFQIPEIKFNSLSKKILHSYIKNCTLDIQI